jgi:hypothetical protein
MTIDQREHQKTKRAQRLEVNQSFAGVGQRGAGKVSFVSLSPEDSVKKGRDVQIANLANGGYRQMITSIE